jgi:hypothetical protein
MVHERTVNTQRKKAPLLMDNTILLPGLAYNTTTSIALHTALSHLDKRNTYVRMLFIDYSSVFNTIVPPSIS